MSDISETFGVKFHIIIPARYDSKRLPGKVLLDVHGKPLIQRVYERALLCGAASVTIATDDHRVQSAAEKFGAQVCVTSAHHLTGTDRLSEAVRMLEFNNEDIVVNFQGDEPLLPVHALHQAVLAMSDHPEAAVTTLCTPIKKSHQLFNPNIVKVVLNHLGYALYFSRSPIPYDRRTDTYGLSHCYYRHLGLYAYRVKTLKKFHHWEPSPLEKLEFLEQLRMLWYGEKIHVSVMNETLPMGVDTWEDLEEIRAIFENDSLLVSAS